MDATRGCWDAEDTAGPWILPGERGTGRERQGRHKKARERMCQEWPVAGLAGVWVGEACQKAKREPRQQGAPMRKPGRGRVISRVLLFSIPGPSWV